jgi:hypothetical protein
LYIFVLDCHLHHFNLMTLDGLPDIEKKGCLIKNSPLLPKVKQRHYWMTGK